MWICAKEDIHEWQKAKARGPSDNSGNAFWIQFNEQGKIVVFQNGVFTNGELNDLDSKDGIKSWEIAWSDEYNKYYRYDEFFRMGAMTRAVL